MASPMAWVLAAHAVRRLSRRAEMASPAAHVLCLVAGSAVVALLSPLPPALVALALTRHAATFGLYYVSTGGLVGWQPGVISFVFLYTFRVLERRRG